MKITKINHSDLPNQIGATITVRSNSDNSEQSGEVLLVEGNNVLVRKGRIQFYVSTINSPATQYVFATQP